MEEGLSQQSNCISTTQRILAMQCDACSEDAARWFQ